MKLTFVKYYYPVVDLTEMLPVVFLISFTAKWRDVSFWLKIQLTNVLHFVAMEFLFFFNLKYPFFLEGGDFYDLDIFEEYRPLIL